MTGLGYGSPKQVAARRAFFMYEYLCSTRAAEDKQFWLNGECTMNINHSTGTICATCPR